MAGIKENFDFFIDEDMHKFSGKWIAILNKKVVASGENLKEMLREVKEKYPKQEPLIVRAPTEKLLIL